MDSQYRDQSFTQLLRDGDAQLVDDFLIATQVATGSSSRKPRGSNFTSEEDVIIVNAWLSTSLDAIVGTDQKMKIFWSRIHIYYHECKKPNHQERSAHSLSNRWSTIQASVNKFCGCLAEIENSRMSGYSEDDKIKLAKASYKDDSDVSFQYDHCWEVLKCQPKWILHKDELNAKKSKEAKSRRLVNCDSSSLVHLGNEQGSSPNSDFPERPPGRKVQKESEKKRKNKEEKRKRLEEIVTRLGEERKELHEEKMAKIDAITQIEEKKIKQKERLVLIAERRLEQEEKDKSEKIMMMDISALDVMQQEYIKKRRVEIMQAMNINLV